VDIYVEQAHGVTGLREDQGQVGGHRALANTALAGEHNQAVPDLTQTRLQHDVLFRCVGG
jgi:hypothetical protein